MLGQSTRFKIYLMLKAISENELIVEEQRQQLAQQNGFEPWAAFKRIDRTGLGKISAHDINQFLKDNMVDYLSELECYHMFAYFDNDKDGFLDYTDFLTLVLPNTDIQLRSKVTQRKNYQVEAGQRLQSNVEFELSRLFEKEIHYHVKVEIEKRELEEMQDFNTVAVFSVLDPLQYGYLDAENLRAFMAKFQNQDENPLPKSAIHSILRRMSDNPDAKITFREFSLAITPELAGLPGDVGNIEFNKEAKAAHAKEHRSQQRDQTSPVRSQKSLRGAFHQIQINQRHSPIKEEFQQLPLKQTENPDTQYVLDMVKMGSPSKDQDALKHSNKVLRSVSKNPILHNHVRGTDPVYDQMWEDAVNGRAFTDQQYEDTYEPQPSPPQFAQQQQQEYQPDFGGHRQPQARHTVVDLLKLIAENEVALELLRQRLVRDCEDFNTVDAFRLLDKKAKCEVTKRELANILVNEIQVDTGKIDIQAIDVIVDDKFKYSHFCEIFVPKSQKVTAELSSKKPKNLRGQLSYNECFDNLARELYASAWEHVLQSAYGENLLKEELMRDPEFDVNEAYRQLTQGKEITRSDLLEALGQHLNQPHVDILYAKLSANSITKTVLKADFIECITPMRAQSYF